MVIFPVSLILGTRLSNNIVSSPSVYGFKSKLHKLHYTLQDIVAHINYRTCDIFHMPGFKSV